MGALAAPNEVKNGTTDAEMAGMTKKQIAAMERNRRIDAELDEQLAKNPDAMPRAVWFILPNEFGERFCFYGLKAFLFRYLIYIGNSEVSAKTMTHTWQMVTYFCPLFGAAICDSYLGKYRTIVWLSLLYLIGNIVLTVTSIPALRSNWTVLLGLYLIGFGTGGIKPCVSPLGGDQFRPTQQNAIRRFFSLFYLSINAGSVLSGFIAPQVKDGFGCFGDEIKSEDPSIPSQPMCYFAGYMLPTVVFAIATAVFIFGHNHYKLVPPAGDFVPGHMFFAIIDTVKNYFSASAEEKAKHSFWSFGAARYGKQFAEDTGEFMRMLLMVFPFSFVWMVYEQQSTEWSDQYDQMDTYWGSVRLSPEVWIAIVNPVLVVILVYVLSTWVYPFIERRGVAVTPLRRMSIGGILVALGFLISAFLQYEVHSNYQGTKDKNGLTLPESCKGKCLHGSWQLPQWVILSLGESLFSPTGSEFAYTQVAESMRAFSTSFWLLMVSLGDFYVVAVESGLKGQEWAEGKNAPNKYFLYTGISLLANVWFIFMARNYKYRPGSMTTLEK
ncbi:hypothetical protein AMAG_13102 [Allomyces macrogynus ATCC 38327]|uniref:Amino acid/peptide transporter (Peptide:H+ symporter) n=1 Tax=Allomyces macrogynus (strain ATCC 38327) TaxID=578462 RepID=A0A0L0T1C5_ALLM3|nr:hypothetical protein AMAG_13102 [Allomyces macrogynus ATCC 38327]|eukprot:KNE68450.1 hypothetical protein AMAG_13102 [Allomyces macrogynus ATCC 38327]